jgi:antirestriction protein
MWIGYEAEYKAKNVDEFVKLISQSLQLSAADWNSWRSRGQQMRCADFQLIVQMVAGGPSLRMLDVAAEETVAQRRQAKEEHDAAAEAAATEDAAEAAPEIVGDKKAKTYYLGTCRPEKEIVQADKITFKTTEEAEKAGFKLAKNCH